ncbi:Uncharacterised protein [Mycobacteroides abscessus subsp. abscessus]|nr:Uncharacterised protein [Mycobacteroides abscessus subsp. abscessus]
MPQARIETVTRSTHGFRPALVVAGPAASSATGAEAEHPLRGGLVVVLGCLRDHGLGKAVQSCHIHSRISGAARDRQGRIERTQIGLQGGCQGLVEGCQHNSRVGIQLGEVPRPMECHDGFPGSRTTREPEGATIAFLDVASLIRMQEGAPGLEIPFFDHPPQFGVVVDQGELHLGRGMFECGEDLFVLVEALVDRLLGEAEGVADIIDRPADRQLQQGILLPGDIGRLRDSQHGVLVRRRKGAFGHIGIQTEAIGQIGRGEPDVTEISGRRPGCEAGKFPGRIRHHGPLLTVRAPVQLADDALEDTVHRIHPQRGLLGELVRHIMLPGAEIDVGGIDRLAVDAEHDRSVVEIDPSGPDARVDSALDRLDVQPREGVIGADFLEEVVDLVLDRSVELGHRLVVGRQHHQRHPRNSSLRSPPRPRPYTASRSPVRLSILE